MLILQGSEVEQSEVLYSNGDKVEKLPGASYDKRLFTSGGLFRKDQSQEAIDLLVFILLSVNVLVSF